MIECICLPYCGRFWFRADQEGGLQRSPGAEEHPQGRLQRPVHPLPGKGESLTEHVAWF